MKNIFIVFVIFFALVYPVKAQSVLSDSLEKTIIDFLEKQEKEASLINNNSILVITYSIPFSKYIVCLKAINNKLCKDSSSSIYKITTFKNDIILYFQNDFITPIKLNDENNHFFLTDEECKEEEGIIYESNLIMLLINNKFSIEKEVKGIDYDYLKEYLLCPTSPLSVQRAHVRKKYGHL